MKFGLTYDLRSDYLKQGYSSEQAAEFDTEETIEGIENAIRACGHKTERIGHIKNLTQKLSEKKSWDIIFNIAEGCLGTSREAQVPALLEAYNLPYTFSDPVSLAVTHNKSIAKAIIKNSGLATPDFFLLENPGALESVFLSFPLFAKPAAEGTGKGISAASKINNKHELQTVCIDLLKKFRQPVLIEEFLPGREFTVGIIGNKNPEVIGVMEVLYNSVGQKIYGYETKKNYLDLVTYKLIEGELAEKCSNLSIRAYQALGCRDAARADLRLDKNGEPSFMEINALPGLNPVDSDLPIMAKLAGIDYNSLIKKIILEAAGRYPQLKG